MKSRKIVISLVLVLSMLTSLAAGGLALAAGPEFEDGFGESGFGFDELYGAEINGYTFAGWWYTDGGEEKQLERESDAVSGKTYTAKWENAAGLYVTAEKLDFTESGTVNKMSSYGYKWDASAKTLTLSGASIDVSFFAGNAVTLPAGSTLYLPEGSGSQIIGGAGEYTNDSDKYSSALYCPGDLTISGEGAVSLSGGGNVRSTGLFCGGKLTIESAKVTSIGGVSEESGDEAHGINALGGITLDGCTLVAQGGYADNTSAIYTDKTLTLSGELTIYAYQCEYSEDYYEEYAIYAGGGINGLDKYKVYNCFEETEGIINSLTAMEPDPVYVSSQTVFYDGLGNLDCTFDTYAVGDRNVKGYVFAGWYDIGGDGTAPITREQIEKGSVYAAKWAYNGETVVMAGIKLGDDEGYVEEDIDGYGVTWEQETRTLTLENACIDCSGVYDGIDAGAIVLPADSTVVLKGVNTLVGPNGDNSDSAAMICYGDLRIKGTGTLNATGTTTGGFITICAGIYASGNITVESGATVNAAGGRNSDTEGRSVGICGDNVNLCGTVKALGASSSEIPCSYGVEAMNDIIISGGSVEAYAGASDSLSFGLYANNAMEIRNATVNVGGGKCSWSSGIYANGTLNIEDSDVAATGGDAPEYTDDQLFNGSNGIVSWGIYLTDSDVTATAGKAASSIGFDIRGEFRALDSTVTATGANVEGNSKEADFLFLESFGISAQSAHFEGSRVTATSGNYKSDNAEVFKNAESSGIYVTGSLEAVSGTIRTKGAKTHVTAVEGIVLGEGVKITGSKLNETEDCSFISGGDMCIISDEDVVISEFEDVKLGTYYYDAVMWAVENGVTFGVSETRFAPEGIATREQMVTFMWRAVGSPEPSEAACKFTDVEKGSYYEKAVLWAVENGVTSGTSETTFSPKLTVSRAQAVTFIAQLMNYTRSSPSFDNHFTDVPAGIWYEKPVAWAAGTGITSGTSETTFSPEDPCTRGQIVCFLQRALDK